MDWSQAECRTEQGMKVNFYPDGAHATVEYAKAELICNACPIRGECLEHALSKPEHHGYWGGMNERQRRNEIKRRQRLARRNRITLATDKVVA